MRKQWPHPTHAVSIHCVGIKHGIVSNHVKFTRHVESKKWLLQKEAREVDKAVAMMMLLIINWRHCQKNSTCIMYEL